MKKLTNILFSLFFLLIFASPTYASVCDGLSSKSECGQYRSCNWDDNAKTCYLNTLAGPKTTFSDNVNFFNFQGIGLTNPDLTSINGIISTFLPFILSFAGIILLFMLISGGFTMLTAVGNPEAADAGKQRITAAILGFIILFVSYWIIQILEIILGINILGSI
jgi:hypothetical protein